MYTKDQIYYNKEIGDKVKDFILGWHSLRQSHQSIAKKLREISTLSYQEALNLVYFTLGAPK